MGALWSILAVATAAALVAWLGEAAGPLVILGGGLLVASVCGYAAVFKRPTLFRSLGAFVALVGGLVALGAGAAWQAGRLAGLFRPGFSLDPGSGGMMGEWVQPAVVVGVFVVPALTLLLLAVSSRVLRVPLTVGVVRGFRGAALPVACVLLLAYGGMVLATTHQEARVSYLLERMVENESRFLAEAAGKPWPGVTRQ